MYNSIPINFDFRKTELISVRACTWNDMYFSWFRPKSSVLQMHTVKCHSNVYYSYYSLCYCYQLLLLLLLHLFKLYSIYCFCGASTYDPEVGKCKSISSFFRSTTILTITSAKNYMYCTPITLFYPTR